MTNGFKIQTINVTVRKNQYNLIFCKKKVQFDYVKQFRVLDGNH